MNRTEYLLNKLKCSKCGDYFQSLYSNEKLQRLFPYVEGDKSYKNLKNMSKWIRLKRKLYCLTCGKKKTISKKLLMKISKLKHDEDK